MTHAGRPTDPVRFGLICLDRYWYQSHKNPTDCVSATHFIDKQDLQSKNK